MAQTAQTAGSLPAQASDLQAPTFYTSTVPYINLTLTLDEPVNISLVNPSLMWTYSSCGTVNITWADWQWFPWAGGATGNSSMQTVLVFNVSVPACLPNSMRFQVSYGCRIRWRPLP